MSANRLARIPGYGHCLDPTLKIPYVQIVVDDIINGAKTTAGVDATGWSYRFADLYNKKI